MSIGETELEILQTRTEFLNDVAEKHLQHKDGFTGISFEDDILHKLAGSKRNLTGVELTKYRGEFLNNHL